MPITDTTEHRFEADIESYLISPACGYTKTTDTYNPAAVLYTECADCSGYVKATPHRKR